MRRIRLADRCGVETAKDINEVAQLPPADSDMEAIATSLVQSDDGSDEDAHEILEVSPGASDEVVKAVYRKKSQELHPDQGGTREPFEQLKTAKEAMLDG